MPQSTAADHPIQDRTISMAKANLLGTLAMIPLIALIVLPFGLLHGWRAAAGSLVWLGGHLLGFVVIFVASVILHEGLHALGWLVFGRVPWSEIRFGIKTATPYAHTSAPMQVGAYRLSAALPGLVLGFMPGVVSLFTGNGLLMGYGALMFSSAAGDALILWLIRDLQAGQLVQDHPTEAGCQVLSSG
jgi:hypothetical protein